MTPAPAAPKCSAAYWGELRPSTAMNSPGTTPALSKELASCPAIDSSSRNLSARPIPMTATLSGFSAAARLRSSVAKMAFHPEERDLGQQGRMPTFGVARLSTASRHCREILPSAEPRPHRSRKDREPDRPYGQRYRLWIRAGYRTPVPEA